MTILILNCGSSSLKYQVFSYPDGKVLKQDKVGRLTTPEAFDTAMNSLFAELRDEHIDAVGHRVVHGGEFFSDAVTVDDDVIGKISACIPLAPLHNPANLAGIAAARKAFPRAVHVAVFDTAFHSKLPRRAATYAIDQDIAKDYGLRRYGFHGMSFAFVAHEASRYLKIPLEQLRLVICHLGNGAGACALEFGQSVETSMGVTPLEGLVMGTRSGDIDPGALLILMREGKMTVDELDDLLTNKSGLKGLSGISNDLRDLQREAAAGHDRARLAIAVAAHRVRKYIGAYTATMGGLDAVILTGGIGENNVQIRRRILHRFEFLGLMVDEENNQDVTVSPDNRVAEISAAHSRVKALVIATNEEKVIADETFKIVSGQTQIKTTRTLPISVSGRHAHLTPETFAELFGDDSELTKLVDLSQPGQFAAEQTVSLIGPRRRIDGVRILGPFRKSNQIEISRTDEFHLGIDAPLRQSGQTTGSAPITVVGSKGQVHLPEGLICAARHIHMTPEDSDEFGVKDGDAVEVAIAGGERDLIFGDVIIRVSPKYRLDMHIDTDEANAAELPRGSEGILTTIDGAIGSLIRRRPRDDE